ncbi:MAG: GNAT family N-acetyltransferase [Patescibacteria group bacterium]
MIKEMTVADIPQILDLRFKMLEENQADKHLAPDWREVSTKYYKEMYEQNKGIHFGYYEDDKLVGIAGGFIRDDFPFIALNCRNYGWILDVFVESLFRKKGIAKTLTESVIKWFKMNGVTFIKLDASRFARKLYEDMGFVQTGEMRLVISGD